ncbi:MAG: aminotransferase class I/II-fold pyridoxal phosphate-dependent enzyme [Collinsella sp.]
MSAVTACTVCAPRHIAYENGVLGGVASSLAVLCSRGDKVLVHAPTYVGFTKTLKNAGYDLVASQLVPDEDGVWRMDFDDMERKLVENDIHAANLLLAS